jgi:hypothetical protein
MTDTGRGYGNIKDAHILRNLGRGKKEANKAGVKDVVAALNKEVTGSISGSKGKSVDATGFEDYEDMSREQMSEAIGVMPESKYNNLMVNAPKSLRSKFPDLPWE